MVDVKDEIKSETKNRYGKNNPAYKHGKTNTRLYEIWRAMKKRCYLHTHKYYKDYGGRGIKICDEWKNSFICFYNWSKENGYKADDIPEYLGLSYASLNMTRESISAFSEALLVRESDALLLSIAEQYYKSKEFVVAEQYLFRIINNSQNDEMIIKSQILLGNIYIDRENYDKALKEFENVLQKRQNSADAHYGIGVIYEKQGNLVKARAEWRQTLKYQVNHQGALQKLSSN